MFCTGLFRRVVSHESPLSPLIAISFPFRQYGRRTGGLALPVCAMVLSACRSRAAAYFQTPVRPPQVWRLSPRWLLFPSIVLIRCLFWWVAVQCVLLPTSCWVTALAYSSCRPLRSALAPRPGRTLYALLAAGHTAAGLYPHGARQGEWSRPSSPSEAMASQMRCSGPDGAGTNFGTLLTGSFVGGDDLSCAWNRDISSNSIYYRD